MPIDFFQNNQQMEMNMVKHVFCLVDFDIYIYIVDRYRFYFDLRAPNPIFSTKKTSQLPRYSRLGNVLAMVLQRVAFRKSRGLVV